MSLFKSDPDVAERYLSLLGDDPAEELWEPLLMTISGIAAGMRNTG
jgi:phosphoenolpyruvate carboxylase